MSRLKEVFNYLKFSKLVDNQGDFANKIGYNRVSVSKAMNGNEQYATEDFISAVSISFPEISKVWLLTGEGEMLKTVKKEQKSIITSAGIEFIETASGRYKMRVPVVPKHSYARYIDDARDAIEWDGEEFIDFPADQVYHGNYLAFEIKGDSMDDDSKRSLSDGDIVNARELSRDKWAYKLHMEKYPNWIIVTDTTILCKQIIDQNLETGDITCHSLNNSPEYTDFTINLNEVRRMFNIVQRMTSSF